MPKKSKRSIRKVSKGLSIKNGSSNSRKDIWAWVLAGLAFVIYSNTLGHGYAFDDAIVITENQFTQKGFGGIYDLLTRDFFEGIYGENGMELTGGRYRPLSLVMFAIENQFFGLNPFVGHFINVLLYAFTALVMYKVLHQWFEEKGKVSVIPLLVTGIFVVHPVHTEVVANIKSRDEILALLLILVAFYSINKVLEGFKKNRWLAIGLSTFFLSMLAKETAFTFVLLIPLALYVFKRKTFNQIVKISIPFWVTAIIYLGLRAAVVGGMGGAENPDIMENPFWGTSFVEKYATIALILLKYLALLVFPHPLSCDYSYNQIPLTNFGNPLVLLGLALYLAMAIQVLTKIWKRDILAYAVLLYFIPLSLTTNILFNIGAPMGERFLYIPSWGFCLAVGYLLSKVFRVKALDHLGSKLSLVVIWGLLILLFSIKTVTRNPDWKNNLSLFAKDVNTVPNSAKIHYYYGNTLLKAFLDSDKTSATSQELLSFAEKHFARAVEINPKFHTAMYNLGKVYVERQNGPKAESYLLKTLEIKPRHINSQELIAEVYGRLLNQPDKALYHLNLLINEAGIKTAKNYQSLGIIYAIKKNFSEAIKSFEKSLQLEPNNANTLMNIGITYQRMGQLEKGKTYLNKAYIVDPSLKK